MTGLARKAILLSAVGLVVAGAVWAGVPSPTNSTKPLFIKLTGKTNPPDPAGLAVYIIRDANNVVVANAEVVLDFLACTDIQLSQTAAPGTVVTCGSKRVTGTTDGVGLLNVNVVGGGNGTALPRATCACVAVTVNSQAFPNMPASTFDRDGVGGVGAGDFSLVAADFVQFPNACRSDFDNSGSVGAGDFSLLLTIFVAGASALSGSPYCL